MSWKEFFVAAAAAIITGLILAFVSKPARAEQWVDVSVTSVHFSDQKFNKNNFGLGYERTSGDYSFMAGRYNNSLGTSSRYVMVSYTPMHALGADIGLTAGALDGYQTIKHGKPFLAAGGLMRWSGRNYGAQLLLLPPIPGHVERHPDGGYTTYHKTPAAIGLQLRWRFK